MIELKKDRKSTTWIITTTDSEGFHRQLNISANDLNSLVRMWNDICANNYTNDCTAAPKNVKINME